MERLAQSAAVRQVLLLEYEKVKDEQRARIAFRENLYYVALIVIGALFSTLLTLTDVEIGYLVLTPILFVISNAYYYNDEIVSRMNQYVRENLGPRVAAASGMKTDEVFQWEAFTRGTRRMRRRLYQLAANFTIYPGASAISLAFFVSRRTELSSVEQISVLICALITALMLIQVFIYADLPFKGRRPR